MSVDRHQVGGIISVVEEGSPAWEVGFEPGCEIFEVDGNVLHDVIDWRWYSAESEIELAYKDLDGEYGKVTLERDLSENWGIEFRDAIFDPIHTCRNACTFCFMRQLPDGLRDSLSVRDDDWRLSFLQGTFITLTNISDDDISRIITQNISPLRVSLHAANHSVRAALIGKHEGRGIEVLERLLASGIEFDAQIVLVPGQNDGDTLKETLDYAYSFPGVLSVGIVPLGFTKHQDAFQYSYDDPSASLAVLDTISPYQEKALNERGTPWVFAADEFYRNAYGDKLIDMLPTDEFYGDYSMFEDGIGIIRSSIDSFLLAVDEGVDKRCAEALRRSEMYASFICGEAMLSYFPDLLAKSALSEFACVLSVENKFFGGNVNVTGLLCATDIVSAILADSLGDKMACKHKHIYLVPKVIFNTDGLTLDGFTIDDIRRQTGQSVYIIASNPLDYMKDIIRIAKEK